MFYIILFILILLTFLMLSYTISFNKRVQNFYLIILIIISAFSLLSLNLSRLVILFSTSILKLMFKIFILLLIVVIYSFILFLLSPLGSGLLYIIICKSFMLLYSLICTYYFVNYYYTSKLSFKVFMFSFLLSTFFNIILLFFTNMFLLNTLSFIKSFLLSIVLLNIFILSLIFLFKVFFRNLLLLLYLFISNVLKFTIILYLMSLFYSHIDILLIILLETLSLKLFLKTIYILSLSYFSGSLNFSIIFLYLLILDKSFCIIFILLLKLFIIVIFLLSCYYFYNVYMFDLLFSKVYNIFKFSYKSNLLIKSYSQQSSFRRNLSTTPSGELLFCNFYYPNIIKGFSESSLFFGEGNLGVNFYCNQEEFDLVKSVINEFQVFDSKVGSRISIAVFITGSIVYIRVCEIKGYNFIDREYFLTYYNKTINSKFYKKSLTSNNFYSNVKFHVVADVWISRINEDGTFKESFIQTILDSDNHFDVMRYDIDIVKCSPTDSYFNTFPLVNYNFFLSDLALLKSYLKKDRLDLNKFIRYNNYLIIKSNKTPISFDEIKTLRVLTQFSSDYNSYLKNCGGKLGF